MSSTEPSLESQARPGGSEGSAGGEAGDALRPRNASRLNDGTASAASAASAASGGGVPTAPRLCLTDFLDIATLQEVQDSFTAVTRLITAIRNADGTRVTAPSDTLDIVQSEQWLDQLIAVDDGDGAGFSAPIIVEGQELGSITIERKGLTEGSAEGKERFREAVAKLGLTDERYEGVLEAATEHLAPNRSASIQFLYLLANNIARLCYEEYNAHQRVEELSALYKLSTLLAAHRDTQEVLDVAARSAADVMKVKAVSIRLVDEGGNELIPRAVYQLSESYMNKGAIRIDKSELFSQALAGKLGYVEDMSLDERILYPDDAHREGLVSMLCAGMVYQGRPIGVVQLYTGELRRFTRFETNLVKAMAHLLGMAIENARMDEARRENQRMIRQLHLAADVQRRMLPGSMPHVPPFEVAARYVPSLELGGDFYDFIDLEGHLGVAVGDVVGKGVAASLLMASVRASLRAYAQDVYDLDEIIARVNISLCHDTLDNEFATLWYGVFDRNTMRLTYCNAGHEPPFLIRDGEIHWLDIGGMVAGVDPTQHYAKGLWDLRPGDLILLYTDGLVDAFDFNEKSFGRGRIEDALREAADRPAGEALNHVLWSLRKFTGLRRSFDDTTLVTVKVGQRRIDAASALL